MTEDAPRVNDLGSEGQARGWCAIFSPVQWLALYQPKWLAKDAIAGVRLAAYGIPMSLAYASLAGLPPRYGIYCYLLGGLFHALLGSSNPLAIGPTSASSMLVGVTVAGMAQVDPARRADIAALTALVVAATCGLVWRLRLSSLVNFISEAILIGIKACAALTMAPTQWPRLHQELKDAGIALRLLAARAGVRELLRAEGVGRDHRLLRTQDLGG